MIHPGEARAGGVPRLPEGLRGEPHGRQDGGVQHGPPRRRQLSLPALRRGVRVAGRENIIVLDRDEEVPSQKELSRNF